MKSHRIGWALAVAAAVLFASCSGGGSEDTLPPAGSLGSDGGQQTSTIPDTSSTMPDVSTGSPAARFIATVTGSDGSPIPWPEVNGVIGDGQGQVTGPADASGWYEVSAAGHAVTYARAVVTSGGFDVLDVELTPRSSPIVIGADEQQVDIGDGASVTVLAGALPPGTWLTVTELPARHLAAPWAPVDGGHRTRVFSFESSAEDGTEVQPSAAITLHLDDASSLGGVTSLATFDPDAGRWVESGECVESGAAVDCTVSHFSLSTPVGGGAYAATPPPPASDDEAAAAEQAAQERAEEAQQLIDDEIERAGEELPGRIESLLNDAAGAARSNPNPTTKDRLATMITYASAYDIDTSGAVEALGDAYKQVASDAIDAATDADQPRCEQMASLVGVVAEGELVSAAGATATGQQAAVDLLTEIEIECQYYWTGTIEYHFPAPGRWEIYSLGTPGPGAVYDDRGIDEWVETALVTIMIDPESGQLEGRVMDAPQFVPLRFRLDLTTPDQACEGEFWEDFIVEGIGAAEPLVASGDMPDLGRAASGAVLIPLEFDGFYEPPGFSVSSPRLAGDPGLRVQTQVDVHTFIVPCQNLSDSTVDEEFSVDPYTTQLLDGFGYLSPVEPRVTLDEMLNSPQRTEPDGRIVIEGRRELSITMDLAVPFKKGTVTWKFTTDSNFEGYGGESLGD